MTTNGRRFILYCETLDGAHEIQKELLSLEGVTVDLVHTPLSVAEALLRGPACAVILNTQHYDSDAAKMIQTWRRVHSKLAVVVVTSAVAKEVFGYKKRQKQVVLFERPVDYGDFKKICRKVIGGDEIYQRRHERFSTEQLVNIENMLTTEKTDGVMKNMSRGGALLKMATLPAEGDVLKISIDLKKVGKQHVIYGEVVRVNVDAFGKNEHGIGIYYISPEELYNALLQD